MNFILPYDDIHDEEVSHQTNDAHDHVDDHDGDLHPHWQVVGVVLRVTEVVQKRKIVRLQREVFRVVHV